MVTLPTPRAGGFTLPELMAVTAIIAILAAVATPSMSDLVRAQRLRSTSTDLFTTLMRARSEAIKRNARTTLAPLSGTAWDQGWSIVNPTNPDDTLEQHDAVSGIGIEGPDEVVFLSNGRVSGGAALAFELSATAIDDKRCIMLDLSGRPYIKKSGC